MYPTIKLAALILGLLVLVGCGSGGKIEFTGEYDPESGIVSVDLGNGTASSSVAVELPEVSWPPEGGTLPPVDLPGLIEEPTGGVPPTHTLERARLSGGARWRGWTRGLPQGPTSRW